MTTELTRELFAVKNAAKAAAGRLRKKRLLIQGRGQENLNLLSVESATRLAREVSRSPEWVRWLKKIFN